jgi:hypothetical protein
MHPRIAELSRAHSLVEVLKANHFGRMLVRGGVLAHNWQISTAAARAPGRGAADARPGCGRTRDARTLFPFHATATFPVGHGRFRNVASCWSLHEQKETYLFTDMRSLLRRLSDVDRIRRISREMLEKQFLAALPLGLDNRKSRTLFEDVLALAI